MKNRIICAVLLLAVLALPLGALAATQSKTFSYSNVTSKTSDAMKFDYENLKYINTWTGVTSSSDDYYTSISVQKKVLLFYSTKHTLNVFPQKDSSTGDYFNKIGKGTYKFKVTNDNCKTSGKLTATSSSSQFSNYV
ncbi:MAG: hypothetical protein J5982_03680 [Bacilli bacterium]|nr:hypothetical protein [Bacilli bacterium]